MNTELIPDWSMKQLEELCRSQPIGDDRIKIGFACDFLFLPKEMLVLMFDKAKSWGIKLFTTHYTNPNSPVFSEYKISLRFSFAAVITPALVSVRDPAVTRPRYSCTGK